MENINQLLKESNCIEGGSKEAATVCVSLNFGVHLCLTTLIWVPWAFVLFLSLSSLPPRDR